MNILDTFIYVILSIIFRRPVGRYGIEGPLPPNPWQPPPDQFSRPNPASKTRAKDED
jgi:hypothetical protein